MRKNTETKTQAKIESFSITLEVYCFCSFLFLRLFYDRSLSSCAMFGYLNLSFPEPIITFSVVLTFESVDKVLWCDHSNETSSAVRLYGPICFLIFYTTEMK